MLQQVGIEVQVVRRPTAPLAVACGGSMVALLLGAGIAMAGFAGPSANPDSAGNLSRFEFVETHMGCAFKIVLYSKDAPAARSASRAAFDRIGALDATLSDY